MDTCAMLADFTNEMVQKYVSPLEELRAKAKKGADTLLVGDCPG
jgi:hypothetical protein